MFTVFGDDLVERQTENYGYFAYAASFWATNYRQAQKKATNELLQSVLEICETQSLRFRNWFHVYWTMDLYFPRPQLTSTTMVASYFGHEAVVKLLLDTGKADVDSKDKCGRTPLSWAARNRHNAVVKLLLDTGKADVNLKDKKTVGRRCCMPPKTDTKQ